MSNKVYSEDGVFVVPAPRRSRRASTSMDRSNDDSFRANEYSTIHAQSQSIPTGNVKEEDIEKQIEHIESFLKVLKARQQFLEAQRKKNEPLSMSGVQDVCVDITRINNDYNKSVHELWNQIEEKQLQFSLVKRAVETSGIQLDIDFDTSIELRKRSVIDLLVQFAEVMESESNVKQDLLEVKREVIRKQCESIHDIDNLLKAVKSNTEQQQGEPLKNMNKKMIKLKIVQDLMNCFLSELDGESLFSDPKLVEILKKYRKPLELRYIKDIV